MKREVYDDHLEKLELELAAMAHWAKATGARVLVLFEGRDTQARAVRSMQSRQRSIRARSGS